MKKVNEKIVVKNVRGSFVHVTKDNPKKNKKGDANGWGMQVIVPKDHPQYKELLKAQKKALIGGFGKEEAQRKGAYRMAIRDADQDGDNYKEEDHFRGCVYFSANSKSKPPGVVNRKIKPATDEDLAELCYSGAYFTLSLNFYPFSAPDDGGKPGIAIGLNNVMLWAEGDRLDGRTGASDDFAELADELGLDDDDLDDDDDWDDIDF